MKYDYRGQENSQKSIYITDLTPAVTTKYVPKCLETNVSIKFLCFANKEELGDGLHRKGVYRYCKFS